MYRPAGSLRGPWVQSMADPIRFTFHLETRARPDLAFRAMSDTDAFNQLAKAGLSFETTEGPSGTHVRGSVGKLGMTIRWDERPFTFRAPSWFRIQRDFENGPASRMTARAQIEPLPTCGAAVRYQLEVIPKSALLRPVVNFDLKRTLEPQLRTALASMVAFLDDRADDELGELDPQALNPPPALTPTQSKVLLRKAGELPASALTDRLVAFIRAAPLRDQYAMSALALAQAWAAPLSNVAALFVDAVRVGLLGVRLDLLCPACLVPKLALQGRDVPVSAHCDTCNIRLDATFAESLAIHFFPSPDVRDLKQRVECFGSPARTPHVVAQDEIGPGATVDLAVPLAPGTYQLRTIPSLGPAALLSVKELEQQRRAELHLAETLHPQLLQLNPQVSRIAVSNQRNHPVVVVLEKLVPPRKVMSLGRMLVDFPELESLVPFSGFLTSVNSFAGAALALRCASAEDAETTRGLLGGARLVHRSDIHVLGLYATADQCLLDAAAARKRWVMGGLAWGAVIEGLVGKTQVPAGPAVDRAYAALCASVPGDCSLFREDAGHFTGTPVGFARADAADMVHFSVTADARATR